MEEIKFLNNIEAEIIKADRITLISHQSPDGDAIGSVLALYHFLKNEYNKDIRALVPDDFPDFLAWIPSSKDITICFKNLNKAKNIIATSDLIFCLDFNHTSRIECVKDEVLKSNAVKVLIDHHPNPEKFADYTLSETKVSSTSELLYRVIVKLNGRITHEIASCLFTGIMTDTGGFSHNSSNPGTFEIVSDLLETGINKNQIFDNIYNNFTADRMRLMGYCLHEKMKFFPEYKTAYISISQKELKGFNFQTGDTEGFVNLPLAIKGVVFSALFIEKDNLVKTSFRSKGNFAVNNFSKKHFNGGGHTNAAGGESYNTMKETLEKFESLLPDYRKEINNS